MTIPPVPRSYQQTKGTLAPLDGLKKTPNPDTSEERPPPPAFSAFTHCPVFFSAHRHLPLDQNPPDSLVSSTNDVRTADLSVSLFWATFTPLCSPFHRSAPLLLWVYPWVRAHCVGQKCGTKSRHGARQRCSGTPDSRPNSAQPPSPLTFNSNQSSMLHDTQTPPPSCPLSSLRLRANGSTGLWFSIGCGARH